MQTLGIATAIDLRQTARGCPPFYVGVVVKAFAAMTEGDLVREFAAGRTHFATVGQGRLVLQSHPHFDWPDVQLLYKHVRANIEALEACREVTP
jgi:hypothetical protein